MWLRQLEVARNVAIIIALISMGILSLDPPDFIENLFAVLVWSFFWVVIIVFLYGRFQIPGT